LGLWLDKIICKSKLPYPLAFSLMALFLYLLGFPFMLASNNLTAFLHEPKWIIVAVFGALNGILVIFVFRKFSSSFEKMEHLFDSHAHFQEIKDKLLGHLTNRFYWIVVAFWLVLNFVEAPHTMRWWWFYNQPQLTTAYELIATLPACILGGMFMYMIPIGLNLAYKDLCSNRFFEKDALISEWMKPFRDFKWLITFTMFGAIVYAVFPPYIWGTSAESAVVPQWITFIPYTGIAIVLVAAVLLPHIFFHRFFSNVKQSLLDDFQRDISVAPVQNQENILHKILLLLEKGEVEKLKTWLLDVKTAGEILLAALMHIGLVEILSVLIQR
jgi:hypothetical protein